MQVKTHAAKAGPLLTLADDAACRCSQLLQRAACEHALGVAFADVRLAVTKGRKPYLVRTPGAKCLQCRSCPRLQANGPASRQHAPNWNFNVSHEGTPHDCSGGVCRG